VSAGTSLVRAYEANLQVSRVTRLPESEKINERESRISQTKEATHGR